MRTHHTEQGFFPYILTTNPEPDPECNITATLYKNIAIKRKQNEKYALYQEHLKKAQSVQRTLCGVVGNNQYTPTVVAPIPAEVVSFFTKHKIPLSPSQDGTYHIKVNQKQIMHALRDEKERLGKSLSKEELELLPKAIQQGRVLFDKSHQNIIFAYRLPNDMWAKFCIQPEYNVKGYEKENLLVTAGVVEEWILLANKYEMIKKEGEDE